jgi:Cu+-exporting ATPase
MAETKNVTLPVTGMTCANCAATIERQVRKLPGVDLANVNLASEKLAVSFDPALLDEHGIIARVERIGYGIPTGKTELPITGLRDNSDALSLEKLLAKQNGVLSCSVSYGTERASLEFIPGMTTIAELAVVIRKAGYDLVQVGDAEELEDVEAQVRAHEIQRQKQLLFIGLVFTFPLVIYSMSRDFGLFAFPNDQYVMLIAATIVQFYVGRQYYVGAFKSLRAGGANMDVLIAMGSSVAYFFSLAVVLGLVASDSVYFETGAAIITLIMLGKFLEARAKGKTSEALKALMDLRAKTAHVVREGREIDIDIEQVVVADLIVVRPGEKVPVDGLIVEGRSTLDESMITGESMPVAKGPGDEIIGATINKEGLIRFEATKVGKNTTLAQIVRMVQEAQGSKAPIQALADRISAYFVPIVIGLALLTFVGWVVIGRADWPGAMIYAVAVLVIACPCALGLATPTAIMVGTTKGAENGILFKNSEALEHAGKVKVVVLDKTGTITRGEPAVTDVVLGGQGAGIGEEELLRLAASAEKGSEHPLGQAIVAVAQAKNLNVSQPKKFQAVSGFGIRALVDDQSIVIGNLRLMKNEGVELGELQSDVERLQAEGKTAMIVARRAQTDGPLAPIGLIAVADTVKPSSREAIAELRQLGLEVIMITGDNQRTAEAIARQVGIERVLAEVLPADKAAEVKKLQSDKQRVAMVGDGINDAPALAQADVGIALGTGTDVAMAAAGITLISGDLRAVGRAISLSRGTMQTIVQNLFWAFFYNVMLIPIAALGFLTPMIAAGAMAFSSIFVVSNSLRLRGYKVQTQAAAKSLPRQLIELTPRLIAPACALAVLIAISTGWLMPAQNASGAASSGMMGGSSEGSSARKTTTYRAFLMPGVPIAAGTTVSVPVEILDQFGKPATDFDDSAFVSVAAVRRDLAYFTETSLPPTANGVLRPELTFPADGQYVMFIEFKPRGGSAEQVTVPIAVGAATTPAAALTPDADFVQTGNIRLRLKSVWAVKANQPLDLSFEAIDGQGLPLSEMDLIPLGQGQVTIVDEALTTLLRSNFTDRQRLQFSVNFPTPGKYVVWFSFWNPDQRQQVPFVIDVQ